MKNSSNGPPIALESGTQSWYTPLSTSHNTEYFYDQEFCIISGHRAAPYSPRSSTLFGSVEHGVREQWLALRRPLLRRPLHRDTRWPAHHGPLRRFLPRCQSAISLEREFLGGHW